MAVNTNDYVGIGASSDGDSGTRHTINHVPETSDWEEEIYQIEQGDYLLGGRNGVLNLPATQLANRTKYLKTVHDKLQAAVEASQSGTSQYEEIIKKIDSLDSNSENNRINHLERLVANAYLAFEMAKIDPDGYDGMLVETFDDGAPETDQNVTTVTSVVSGDDSVDVEDASGLLIGAHYQLTDGGEHLEEVQVKSIAVSGKINRVKLFSPVKNQYTDGRAKLYRSSVAIYNGRAYGGGNRRVDEWTADTSWSGTNTKQDVSTELDYTDTSAFTISGAVLENGKLVLGDTPVGIALVKTGGGSGTWARVDKEGDDL